ncbi:Chromosome partition protein smc [hydrothermal vent metagenome]|uniref:Chromosome partition protein smc n=1 Tax=hydrothermal vent metagenome TaxID=652676 RepID=A0A3B1DBK6_9ZZZZ
MLKSLELTGFKSFADRTVFDFSTGITAVVGPNGSGKSNVVDGIKWILGDQSAKSLRGKEMTDVIFNGSTNRKPSNFAEATLTFDNRSRFLPRDEDTVSIGRRILRSGDAEYLINGETTRLRDVRELLAGTGAGASAYAIIEQGRVDQILQANATTRRSVFEEAAGISRFKSKKGEAQRKLDRVDQNLLRLTDIVDEVESQRNSLRSQATKAAKYREISQELKTLWMGLVTDDVQHLAKEIETLSATLQQQTSKISSLTKQQQQLEEKLQGMDGELTKAEATLKQFEKQSATIREEMASHRSAIRHNQARQEELTIDIVRLEKQRTLLATRAREVVDELAHNQNIFEKSEAELQQYQTGLQQRKNQKEELTHSIKQDQNTIKIKQQQTIQINKEISSSENRIATLQAHIETTLTATKTLQQKHTEQERVLQEATLLGEKLQQEFNAVTLETEQAEIAVQKIRDERRLLQGEQSEGQQSVAQMREQRSAWQARKSLLEDMELRQEGMGIGAKEILSRATKTNVSPWNSIHGTVANLFDVDIEQAALLEVALGERAELIVIDDFDPLIDYLNSGNHQINGRVQFIEVVKPESLSSSFDLSQHPGVVMRADELVKESDLVSHLPLQVLSDTWVVETLEVARQLASKFTQESSEKKSLRFVTLQGELLDTGGTLVVGIVQTESALVSRKSELRRLRNDLTTLEQRIQTEENRLRALVETLGDKDDALEIVEVKLQQQVDLQNEQKAIVAAHTKDIRRNKKELTTTANEIINTQKQIELQQQKCQQAQKELTLLQEKLNSHEEESQQLEQAANTRKEKSQQLEQQEQTARLDFAKREERVNSLRNAYSRLQKDQQTRIEQSEEAERRYETACAKQKEIQLQLLNSNAILDELTLVEERLDEKLSSCTAQCSAVRHQRTSITKEEAAVRAERRQLNELEHAAQMKIRDIEHQQKNAAERIEEEYQMTIDEVVATGKSAYQDYLQEHFPEAFETPVEEFVAEESAIKETEQADGIPTENPEVESIEVEDSDNPSHPFADIKLPSFEEVRDKIETRVNRLRRKMKSMGGVNTNSLDDLDELEERYEHLSSQLEDLQMAKEALEEIIRRINIESKRLFVETFESIRGHFHLLFRKLFGGGEGDIVLEDPDDVLECGIDIVARPPGKELRSISLLSGGERTMTAVAMLLAIFKSKPSPFCILDECDAALDEANVDRYVNVLTEFKESTQFIMITHRKPSMAEADMLYGVTMEQSGVSKRMNVRFDDVNEHGEFNPSTSGDNAHAA